jgi:predicted Zn finger-like uncharacterized protein
VIIECSSCQSKYQYDEARFDGKASKKIKCAKCQTVFEILNPAAGSKGDSTASRSPTKSERSPTRSEATQIGRPKRVEEQTAQSEIPVDPRSTDRQAAALALPVGKRLSLAIIDGPDSGLVFRIEKPRITIGRAGADLTIDDTEASRQHAAIEVRDTIYLLHDLGSTNGTLINGERIQEPTEISSHSEFQVGATTMMLIVTDEA